MLAAAARKMRRRVSGRMDGDRVSGRNALGMDPHARDRDGWDRRKKNKAKGPMVGG
jgi:hypothetical protein